MDLTPVQTRDMSASGSGRVGAVASAASDDGTVVGAGEQLRRRPGRFISPYGF